MPALHDSSLRGGRTIHLMRPAVGLAAAADALAGYVVASPALPREAETLAAAPLLAASALLLVSAGNVFAVAFACESGTALAGRGGEISDAFARAVEGGRATLKRAFLLAAALALAGLFAAMGAGLSAGRLPVYFAAGIFLVSWARAGRVATLPVLGPASAGATRALALGLGMSAHRDIVYLGDFRPVLAVALLFALGALVEALAASEGEGGRRYLLLGAVAGLAAVFAGAGYFLVDTALAWIIVVTGAAVFAVRGLAAVRTLVPADIRRFAEAALISGFFLDSALCLGRWEATGAVLALGSLALALVVPGAMMLARS